MASHMGGKREGEEEREGGRNKEGTRERERERATVSSVTYPYSGEFWHEPTGRLYKGRFREGKFHGHGELLWFADSEARKKYIGEFRNGEMSGQGEMK